MSAIAGLTLAACTTAVVPPPASNSATARATPSVAVASAVASVGTRATAAPGRCTNPQMTTLAVIQRYFELSTSKDSRAVSDCFAASWRARFVTNPSWDEVAAQWASAGGATSIEITSGDTVKGCDRYRVAAKMATGYLIGQSGSEAITVGPEGGTPRIFEIGTALVSAELATTTCR